MFAFIEVNMTIICACVPSLKPLAHELAPAVVLGLKVGGHKKRGSKAEGTPREMMGVITKEEKQKQRMDAYNQYPQNVKLINLLNMRPRRMLRLNQKQSIPPIAFVTTLFFLWGTAFGFLNVLGSRFQLTHLGPLKTWFSQGAYWLGYLPFPLLVGRLVLKRLSFGATFITGLYVYPLGVLVFWPAAVLVSFPLSFASNFVIGSGLGTLEISANSYIALCGPLDQAEVRLCIAQAFQGIGSLVSRLLSDKILLPDASQVDELINVQWTFLAISLTIVLLALCFYYIPVPEASNNDLREVAELRPEANTARLFGVPVIYVKIYLAVWAQFIQLAASGTHTINFPEFVRSVSPK